jgi:hypothetical protein
VAAAVLPDDDINAVFLQESFKKSPVRRGTAPAEGQRVESGILCDMRLYGKKEAAVPPALGRCKVVRQIDRYPFDPPDHRQDRVYREKTDIHGMGIPRACVADRRLAAGWHDAI